MTARQVANARAKIAKKGYYTRRINRMKKHFLYWAEQSNYAMTPGGGPLFSPEESEKNMKMFSRRLDYYLKKTEQRKQSFLE